MTSSGRTAHIGLWREIVSKRHHETQPVNCHLDFIRKRFEELDLQGFMWSKESILGIFLQLGLPASTNGPFSSVTKTIESRALQGIKISSEGIQEVIKNEELKHKSRPLGLMDLPFEVFEKILEKLDCMARLEAESILSKKQNHRMKVFPPGDHEPYLTYLNHGAPILNSIQSFSLACREIYQLCRPWLWRRLEFPTSLPGSMDLWTKDILLRQGSHVQSLTLTLSENCSKSAGEFEECPPLYDNLTPDLQNAFRIKHISPNNIKALIKQCPNLSTLAIKFWYVEDIGDYGKTEDFLIQLIPLLSSLKRLRHFSFEDETDGYTYMHEFPSQLICSLPLLQSLVWNGSTGNSFGFQLSKLKFLSRLHLERIYDTNEDWCIYDWPKTITDLSIHQHGSSSPRSAHQLIHHIAPHLTKLRLELAIENDDDWKRFSLPLLTELELTTDNDNVLDSFRDCISIRSLHWSYFKAEHCQSLHEILLQSPWPQLSTLVVVPDFYDTYDPDGEHREFEDQLVLLEEYCKQANLNFLIHRPSN